MYCTLALFRFVKLHALLVPGLVFSAWIGCCIQASQAEDTSSQPAPTAPRKAELSPGQTTKLKKRKFVREWKVKDLRRELHLLNEGRDFSKGKGLFTTATCVKCHQINKAGGTIGPDLTGVTGRNSRLVILREVIEPSGKIPKEFQPMVFVTSAGKTYAGLIVRQDEKSIFLSNDPDNPDQLLEIPREDIEEQMLSEISIMPTGLLNTLQKEEILDLLAYVEAGGQEDHPAFDPVD